jgi:hypothetical protein
MRKNQRSKTYVYNFANKKFIYIIYARERQIYVYFF